MKNDTDWQSKSQRRCLGLGRKRRKAFHVKERPDILGIDTDEEFLTIEKWFEVILRKIWTSLW